jgi:hypothetical protein
VSFARLGGGEHYQDSVIFTPLASICDNKRVIASSARRNRNPLLPKDIRSVFGMVELVIKKSGNNRDSCAQLIALIAVMNDNHAGFGGYQVISPSRMSR